jgi:hypothetical protein
MKTLAKIVAFVAVASLPVAAFAQDAKAPATDKAPAADKAPAKDAKAKDAKAKDMKDKDAKAPADKMAPADKPAK